MQHAEAARNTPLPPGDSDFEEEQQEREFRRRAQYFGSERSYRNGYRQQAEEGQPALHKVKLPQLWVHDVRAWFTLAESTFDCYNVTASRMRFNQVLMSLSPDTLEHVRTIMHNVDTFQDPYTILKERLQELYQVNCWELVYRILHAPELGDRTPSQLMAALLAQLPHGETDGLLFKGVFLSRLPDDIRDHVAARGKDLSSTQMAALADDLWHARNARRATVAAIGTHVELDDDEETVSGGVAAINLRGAANRARKGDQQKKNKHFKKEGGKHAASKQVTMCAKHAQFGESAYFCADKKNCWWSQGN